MAARDDHYRNQKTLNSIFAVSCVAMLVTTIWMFWADYAREFKVWQRKGFDVEVALLEERIKAFDTEYRDRVRVAEDRVREEFKRMDPALLGQLDEGRLRSEGTTFMDKARRLLPVVGDSRIREAELALARLKPELVRKTDLLSATKAEEGSLTSFRDIMLAHGIEPDALNVEEQRIRKVSATVAAMEVEVQNLKREQDRLLRMIEEGRARVTGSVNDLGAVLADRDRQARQISQRTFGGGAAFRAWPILDAFASPYRIQQHTPDGLNIDYNFKYVQRNDRCATCHVFIERSGFSKEDIAKLAGARSPDAVKLDKTDPKQLSLTTADINVYANHPRLDLFVGSNSPHSAEKFGCTVCHSGQGGSTTFNFAYHFPDSGVKYDPKVTPRKGSKNEFDILLENKLETYGGAEGKRARWEKEHGWQHDLHPNFLWEYPMLPNRFIESTCLKCHHQVTDLISSDGREQAPKVLKGYRLLRDNGCFACHEIHGWKGGQQVGPDLRLEPSPAPDELSAQDRAKLFTDPSDPPGKLRKNGPGLRRVAEKSDRAWMERWIRSPRSFRPETKMPHFFGQQNNHPTQLSDYQKGDSQLPGAMAQGHPDMKGFPDAEIRAMAYYLHKSSDSYLARLRQFQGLNPVQWAEEQRKMEHFRQIAAARDEGAQKAPRRDEQILSDDAPLPALLAVPVEQRQRLTKDQLRLVLEFYSEVMRLRQTGLALDTRPWPPQELAGFTPDPKRGEKYFELKGCLACHSQETIRDKYRPEEKDDPNAKMYDDLHKAHFGPPLVGLAEKLGYDKNDPKKAQRAEKWLYAWLTNPMDYHPRTNMPNPRLEPQERADLVAWLLQDSGNRPAPTKPDGGTALNSGVFPPALWWDDVKVAQGDVDGLLKTYLQKALPTKADVEAALKNGIPDVSYLRADADERLFAFNPPEGSPGASLSSDERKLYYLGKKSIGKYGCYSCHDIPGFEGAKPIGTPLNDWGRKDPERLAFDNINKYLGEHHKQYDPFFKHALEGHPGRRDGFLYQKLAEPRSYDYEKYQNRPWDDRLKMPQFRFAHSYPKPGEKPEAFQKRAAQEEHDAREAVMTFVLGLVAEPINPKFVYQPSADRKHEVRGVQVLEKYNCVGCHTVKPGVFETTYKAETGPNDSRVSIEAQMQAKFGMTNPVGIAQIPYYPESNAWKATQPYQENRVLFKGLPNIDPDTKEINVELWEAAPFRWNGEEVRDDKGRVIATKGGVASLPAGFSLTLPANTKAHDPHGGLYTSIHAEMVRRYDNNNNNDFLRSSSVPSLIRQGQKTQPKWLHEFILNPIGIRPAVYRYLRMPQFNMSDEEAETLVNYFIAVDRLGNPGLNLDYFSRRPVQQDPQMQQELRRQYVARLQQLTGMAEKDLKNPKNDYFTAGWTILLNKDYCFQCHDFGNYRADVSTNNGPSLHMAADRLRPDYIERWVAWPRRTLPYTVMPDHRIFYNQPDYPQVQQDMRGNAALRARTLTATGLTALSNPLAGLSAPLFLNESFYNELQKDFALSPQEKLWATRDAIMSWGFLVNPPPLARGAGPRPDAYSSGETK